MRRQEERGYAHTRDEGSEFPCIYAHCFSISGEIINEENLRSSEIRE